MGGYKKWGILVMRDDFEMRVNTPLRTVAYFGNALRGGADFNYLPWRGRGSEKLKKGSGSIVQE